MRSISGAELKEFVCPSDREFVKFATDYISDIARCGVSLILFDDDFRYGFLSDAPCCLCDNHIALIGSMTGESLTREELYVHITSGGKNKFRDAYLKTNGDLFRAFAKSIRMAVDRVDPSIRVGACACMSSWDLDGTDAYEIAKILAGGTKPFVRLIGAPYWMVGKAWGNNLQDVVELERMEASWNDLSDIELIAEGDAYPRPRINCAANYLEGFDTALRASGELDGILKICVDYVSNVGYEKGYLKQYIKNKPVYNEIEKHFSNKKHTGIRVYESRNKVAAMQIPNALGGQSDMQDIFFSSAARMLAANAIPTVYDGCESVGIAFGENAYSLKEENFKNGLVIDALAAKILKDKGIDVGIDAFGAGMPIKYQYFCDEDNYVIANNCIVYGTNINSRCKVLSYGSNDLEKADIPFCFLYENDNRQKFLVFNCNAKDSERLLKHQGNAKMIAENAEWLCGRKLPAFCYGHPNLYMQCKEDERQLVIGIWNFFEDEAIEPVVKLGAEYRKAEILCGEGKLCGDSVQLDDIPPFGFRAIVLEKTVRPADRV
jgi:hypothetical protein